MKHAIKMGLLLASLTLLSACGGEDDLSGDKFTVNLDSVDIRLAGTGESITVDTAGVNSGTLTLKRN